MDDAVNGAQLSGATGVAPEPLFFERGASWYWVLAGPFAGIAMLLVELQTGLGPQPLVPLAFLVLVSGFIGLQIKAARIHTSVELTAETLRQGTETILVRDIVMIYPSPENLGRSAKENLGRSVKDNFGRPAKDVEKWQSARALGELTGVPRGRTGIGLQLTNKRIAQAWARRHRELREALTALVEQRTRPAGRDSVGDDDTDAAT
jgi:hypothetical protein